MTSSGSLPTTLLWGAPQPLSVELLRDIWFVTSGGNAPSSGDFSTAVSYAPRSIAGIRLFTALLQSPVGASRFAGILLRGVKITATVNAAARESADLQGEIRLIVDVFDSDPRVYPPPAPYRLRESLWSWTMPRGGATLQVDCGDVFFEWEWSDRPFAAFQIHADAGLTATAPGVAADPDECAITVMGELAQEPAVIIARKCSKVWR